MIRQFARDFWRSLAWSLALAFLAGAGGGIAAVAVMDARDRFAAARLAEALEDRRQADRHTAKALLRFTAGLADVGAALAAAGNAYNAHQQPRSYPGGIDPARGYPPAPAR